MPSSVKAISGIVGQCVDTLENWELQNPLVPNGMLCIEKSGTNGDIIKVKIGDGVKNYLDLDYFPEASSTIPLASETEYGIVKKCTIAEMITGEENTKFSTPLIHNTYHLQDGHRAVPATGTTNNGKILKAGATPASETWDYLTAAEVGAAPAVHDHDLVDDIDPGYMSPDEHIKLAFIEDEANNYTHPEFHPATVITEDADHRFVTDLEKDNWNNKQDPETTLAGYGIIDAAPISHVGAGGAAHAVVTDLANGFMSKEEHVKLTNIEADANNYIHPENHPATIIVEDSTHRFTSDTEKQTWNAKQDPATTLAGYGITDAAPLSHVGSRGTAHGLVDDTNDGFMSKEEHTKLADIEAGANLYVHPATHDASMVVEDASHRFVTDTEKSTWNAKQDALGFTPEDIANKNIANGYAGLDVNGKLYENQLPSIAIIDTFEASSEVEMLALSAAERGDVCIRSDISKTFILAADDYTLLANWKELRTPTDAVLSVAGKTGVVVLNKSDVGLGNVDNTADINKNVNSAATLTTARSITLTGDVTGTTSFDGSTNVTITAVVADDSHNHVIGNVDGLDTALAGKAPLSHVGATGDAHGVVTDTENGFMSFAEHLKLTGISDNANNYIHPATHDAGMIVEDGNHRFVTDLEKAAWDGKQDPETTLAGYGIIDAAPIGHVGSTGNAHGIATTQTNGFMTIEMVTKLNGIADEANDYVHPNHTGDVTSVADGAQTIAPNVVGNTKLADMVNGTIKGRSTAGTGDPEDLTAAQVRTILNVEDGANDYTHPATHPATMITEDATHRFATDAEKLVWNGKPNLGELSTDAYRGDRGKIAYDHSQVAHAPADAQKNSDITKTEIENKLTGIITSHDHSSISGNAATATKLAAPVTINGVSFDGSANITVVDTTKQPVDADLTAIAALAGTSGLLKKTAANTWTLDTTTYSVSGHTHAATDVTQDATHRFVTDTEKSTWNGKQDALGFTPENVANKNIANGYAGLDADGKISSSQLPSLAITDTFEAASDAAMIALSAAEKGDVCIRSDLNKTYILADAPYSTLSNWKELKTPTDTVLSVAGKTGVVTLTKSDVGLGNVDNTSDLNKPVSTATQTALNGKVNTSLTINSKPLTANVVLTTADVADSTDKRYVTDAQRTVLSNTSGVNTGDETSTSLGTKISGATEKTAPVDADLVPLADSAASFTMKKLTIANLKAFFKTYFDTLYNKYVHPNHTGDVTSVADGTQTIAANAVTNPKLADMATATIKGRVTAGTGDPEDLTATQVRTLLNVADGANAYVHPSTHPPSIIVQDASNRFVTDAEKTAWNAKSTLALGETSTTAYRGDRGKIAYDHSQAAHAPADAQKNSDILQSEIEAKLVGLVNTHNHNLADMAEKSYDSLTDKPDIDELTRRTIDLVCTTGATYLKFAETIVDPIDYYALIRITVSSAADGTIYHNMLVELAGHKNSLPAWTIDTKTNNSTAATSGIQILRMTYPKTAGNGYKAELELYCNNATQREIKIEVIEAKGITFLSSLTASSYNSTYQNVASSTVMYNGIITNGTIYGAVSGSLTGNASSASFLLANTFVAGEALVANDLIYLNTDNKWYKAFTVSNQIPLGAILARSNGTYAIGANVSAYMQGVSAVPTGKVGVVGKDAYIRGQISGGVFVSDGTMSTSLDAGYSYMRFASCITNTSTLSYDGNNRVYTVNADGELSALDNLNIVQAVTSVAGKTGDVTLVTADITQSTDKLYITAAERTTWNAKQDALGFTPEDIANKNIANGYAGLDASGKILEANLPSIAIVDTYTASSQTAMLALSSARKGDICIRTDLNKTYILGVDGYSTLANWYELKTPTDAVLSVAGRTGAITLTTADVAASTNKQYVTDAQLTVIGNTSGVNSGDETTTTIGTLINGATAKTTPVDADLIPIADSAASFIAKKLTFANLKATLKTYFDTLYNKYVHPNHTGDVTSVADGAQTIATNVVTNAKLATVATGTIKGRTTAGTGNVEDLTAAQARTVIDVYSKAEVDAITGDISAALAAIIG